MPKKITKEENDEINSALAELENEDEIVCDYTERQEELDWMAARLCEMSKKISICSSKQSVYNAEQSLAEDGCMQERSLLEILDEMLTEYEIFVNNSEQLIKEAKKKLREEKRKCKAKENSSSGSSKRAK